MPFEPIDRLPSVSSLFRWTLTLTAAAMISACGSGSDELSGEAMSDDVAQAPSNLDPKSKRAWGQLQGNGKKGSTEPTDPTEPAPTEPTPTEPTPTEPTEPTEPTDPVPDDPVTSEPTTPTSPDPVTGAYLQYTTRFESPVSLPSVTINGNADQYLQGGDVDPFAIPLDLWNTPSIYRAWILSVVGSGTPMPSSSYIENGIKTVTGRNGAPTRAISLHSKAKSPNTGVQQVAFQNAWMGSEPVMYQRMWVKFDTGTLSRAQAIGPSHFWQMFWEVKADPDYRIRLQLQYDTAVGLYWQVQGDLLANANAVWSNTLKTVPVKLAPKDSASGWHKVEIWMNRPAGRFKTAIDGNVLVDYSGKLMGASGNRVSQFKLAMVYGQAGLGELLVDDLQIWSAPPADAWQP